LVLSDVVRVEFAANVTKRTVFAASTPVETVFVIRVLMEAVVAVVSNVETEFVFPDEKTAELSVSDPVLRVLTCREEIFATDVYKFAVESVVVLNWRASMVVAVRVAVESVFVFNCGKDAVLITIFPTER
jgi:hypothetical protein